MKSLISLVILPLALASQSYDYVYIFQGPDENSATTSVASAARIISNTVTSFQHHDETTPITKESDVAVGCLDEEGCRVIVSPPSCALKCDAACDAAIVVESIQQGRSTSFSGLIPHGSLFCATGQISASVNNIPLVPGSNAGTKFSFISSQSSALVCSIFSFEEETEVTVLEQTLFTSGDEVTTLVGKYKSLEVSTFYATGFSLGIVTDNPVVVSCFSSDSGSVSFTNLQPVTRERKYGFLSTSWRGTQVNCDTLAVVESALPSCVNSEDQHSEDVLFKGAFGYLYFRNEHRYASANFSGDAFTCKANSDSEEADTVCLGAYSTDENSVSWIVAPKFSDYFVLPYALSHIGIISVKEASCEVKGSLETKIVTSGSSSEVLSANFHGDLAVGTEISCDRRVGIFGTSEGKSVQVSGAEIEDNWDAVRESLVDLASPVPTVSPTKSPVGIPTPNPTPEPTTAEPTTAAPTGAPAAVEPETESPTVQEITDAPTVTDEGSGVGETPLVEDGEDNIAWIAAGGFLAVVAAATVVFMVRKKKASGQQ